MEMVLNYLGISIAYTRLRRLLRAGEEFTPFSHLQYLEQLGLSITLGKQGDLSIFEPTLALGLPVVVGVQTLGWHHWGNVTTEHAVLVVGIDPQHDAIYINDPFFAEAPIELSLDEFIVGWQEKDRQYAIIGLAPLEEQI
jgi:hypothetical protein